ncbi:MAG: arylsulfatase [Cryomorphaceae bacterium MED-G14]|nr:MAG: arylsulfatase [Cryomorphaceae bacterium MED-G14]|tara:strand:- start:247 stop:1968 length:1722 start_codon:yes stop_codon:yes gene_type:complete
MRIGLFILFIFTLHLGCSTKVKQKPNIIIIITDDQGYGDIGFNNNSQILTSNLDLLASQSIRFNNFYVSPVCAPTRSSLLTGRYSLRTGVTDTYNGGAMMSTDELTLSEILRENNYNTGIFGKWHLGDSYPFRPTDQGFNESLIHLSGGIGQVGDFTNYYAGNRSYFDPILWHNNEQKKYDGYCSDIFTDEALKFIESNKSNQFFCYLSFNAPHTPLQLPEKYYDLYKDLDPSLIYEDEKIKMSKKDINDAKKIYGMITNIDHNVGKLIKKLKELKIDKNTILIFMTDNGAQQKRYASNLRGLKGKVYEGGIKVPFYLKFPKIHGNNGKDINSLSAHIDVLPSLLNLCDIEIPKDIKIDGKNFLNKPLEERSFFSYWTRKSPELYQNMSLNKGKYKLVGNTNYDSPIESFELFDIDRDPYEIENLIDNKKEVAIEMKMEMDNIYNELINSNNIINKPRIIIGSEYENPSFLNRNDASGQRGIWAQNEIFGFWRTKVYKGKYNFRFKFNNLNLKSGQMVIEVGSQVFSKKVETDDNGYVLMENIHLNEGEFDITPFFRYERKNILPFWVKINKL